ncbi:MAG: SDR family NAD(P)-dependent oxidoreductase [Gaiellaceae bacterium]
MAQGVLEGKTALVTGASRNLGAVIAESLATAGATVALGYKASEREARELAARLGEATGREHPLARGDLATEAGVRSTVGTALDALGRVDVLVNNAGPWGGAPFAELAVDEFDTVWQANVRATYLASQLVAPGMREAGWGRIVNLSAGSRYVRSNSVYGLAKDAIVFLTEELACELGPEITVNALAPGQIAESGEEMAKIDPDYVPRAIAATPAGRLVTRAEVAELALVFCTPAFDLVTGATIPVDGGWRFHRF